MRDLRKPFFTASQVAEITNKYADAVAYMKTATNIDRWNFYRDELKKLIAKKSSSDWIILAGYFDCVLFGQVRQDFVPIVEE